MATGALSKDPSTAQANAPVDVNRIQTRLSYLNRVRPRDPEINKLNQQLAGTNSSGASGGAMTSDPSNSFNGIANQANQGIGNIFSQINSQGAFNPGNFDDLQKQAQDAAMGSFNRTYEPQFQKQDADFQQRLAEKGIDPNSEGAKFQYQQQQTAQANARQGAQDSAFQQGLAAQNQAFTQAFNKYQMPFQNLNSYTPYYQNQFSAQQNDLDRQQQTKNLTQQGQQALAQIRASPHGGGNSFDQQIALQNNAARNALIAGSAGYVQQPNQGAGNGFASGIGAGIAGALGSALRF